MTSAGFVLVKATPTLVLGLTVYTVTCTCIVYNTVNMEAI